MTAKRERRQLAKAESLMDLAIVAGGYASDLRTGLIDGTVGIKPVAEWGDDDPHVIRCRTYGLTPVELAAVFTGIADELEARAERAGFERTWDEAEP